ncbi:DUF5825 family protein [Solwaraspora sp. WMMA2080]|uniref:DUF5825 family protein n=1 Tax=unclassified Solwaraspora TaxID=2627926 RepID=UPI00248C753E|nr:MULTISPECIES: DUF5825 family protein [unclassified Solwaraspora]WBB96887.1 DUF5825 family protein [Solwaraspora sp. WMMA2059]WBC19208.1 DUF5825 family protein [Solwaraspora sp. WMMA2080]
MISTDIEAPPTGPVVVRLHRDHDPAVADIPGIDLGTAEFTGSAADTVGDWLDRGVRKVALPGTVDLTAADSVTAADAVRRLVLVRELTSYAIEVDWSIRLPGGDGDLWRVYGHLRPPATVEIVGAAGATGAAGSVDAAGSAGAEPDAESDPGTVVAAAWRDAFYFDKCTYRRGPGFVQVRDRRAGRLNLLTIDDPAYLAVLEQLLDGAGMTTVDLDIAREFGEEGLVTKVGDQLVWLPHRLRRWPLPSMVV